MLYLEAADCQQHAVQKHLIGVEFAVSYGKKSKLDNANVQLPEGWQVKMECTGVHWN